MKPHKTILLIPNDFELIIIEQSETYLNTGYLPNHSRKHATFGRRLWLLGAVCDFGAPFVTFGRRLWLLGAVWGAVCAWRHFGTASFGAGHYGAVFNNFLFLIFLNASSNYVQIIL